VGKNVLVFHGWWWWWKKMLVMSAGNKIKIKIFLSVFL